MTRYNSTAAKPRAGNPDALLADFRYLLRRFLAFSETKARAEGLTPQQHQALLAIRGSEAPPTIGTLAERLAIRHHSAVGLADRLTRAGLVARKPDREDRRRVQLALTPAGARKLRRLSAAHRDELKRLAPTLREILDRL